MARITTFGTTSVSSMKFGNDPIKAIWFGTGGVESITCPYIYSNLYAQNVQYVASNSFQATINEELWSQVLNTGSTWSSARITFPAITEAHLYCNGTTSEVSYYTINMSLYLEVWAGGSFISSTELAYVSCTSSQGDAPFNINTATLDFSNGLGSGQISIRLTCQGTMMLTANSVPSEDDYDYGTVDLGGFILTINYDD